MAATRLRALLRELTLSGAKLFEIHQDVKNEALSDARSRITEVERELAKAKSSVEKLEAGMKESEESAQSAQTRIQQLDSDVKAATAKFEQEKKRVSGLQENSNVLQSESNTLKKKIEDLEKQDQASKTSAQHAQTRIEQLDKDAKAATAKLEEEQKRTSELGAELRNLRPERTRLEQKVATLEKQDQESKTSAQADKTRIQQLTADLQCAETIEAGLTTAATRNLKTIRSLQSDIDMLTEKLKRLEADIEQPKSLAQAAKTQNPQLLKESEATAAHGKRLSGQDLDALQSAAAADKNCPSGEEVQSLRRVADLHLKCPRDGEYKRLMQSERDHADRNKECNACQELIDIIKSIERQVELIDMEMD